MKITVCGNFGVTNIGDEAILGGVKVLLAEAFPGSEITVQGKGNLFPCGIRSFLKSLVKPSLWETPALMVKASDLYILGGGGLFDDTEGPFISSFWALQGLIAARTYKKPLIIMGVSLGAIRFWNKFLVKHLFKSAKVVAVRDQASLKILQSWGITKGIQIPDLSLFYPYDSNVLPKLPKPKDKYIILSIRPFKNNDENMYKILAQLCDYITGKYGFYIRLLPLQKDLYNDTIVLNKIFEQSNYKDKIKKDEFSDDIPKVLEVFQQGEAAITMRFHAGIFALLANTPFLAFSYMQKVTHFWETVGYPGMLPIEKINLNDLQEKFDQILQEKPFYRGKLAAIKTQLEGQKQRITTLFKSALSS